MEKFKEKLKVQNTVTLVCCVCLLAMILWPLSGELGWLPFPEAQGDSHWQSAWRGFISGASTGVFLLMLVGFVKVCRALGDEKKLRALYIKANDERMKEIGSYARASAMQTALMVGLVAGVVAGYFSMTVSITIIGCVLAASLLVAGFLLYYKKKF